MKTVDELLKDLTIPERRREALDELEARGPGARAAVPTLQALLEEAPDLAGPINVALRKIDPPAERPTRPPEPAPEPFRLESWVRSTLAGITPAQARGIALILAVVLVVAVGFGGWGRPGRRLTHGAGLLWLVWGSYFFCFPPWDLGGEPFDPEAGSPSWVVRILGFFTLGALAGLVCLLPAMFISMIRGA